MAKSKKELMREKMAGAVKNAYEAGTKPSVDISGDNTETVTSTETYTETNTDTSTNTEMVTNAAEEADGISLKKVEYKTARMELKVTESAKQKLTKYVRTMKAAGYDVSANSIINDLLDDFIRKNNL